MTYDCMSEEELADWREGAARFAVTTHRRVVKSPCWDCPLSFRLEELAAGRCCLPDPRLAQKDYNAEWMRMHRASDGLQS